jgi:type III pantothenate kinase
VILVTDIGNTRIKAGFFSGLLLVKSLNVQMNEWESLITRPECEELEGSLIAAVREIPEGLVERLQSLAPCRLLDASTPVPLINLYQTPLTLGRDRLANACAAVSLYPGRNVLVVDMGTCLKLDLVTKAGEYIGGSISPGLMMRYRALNEFTARLPLLEPLPQSGLTGRDTTGSIHAGVMEGFRAETDGMIDAYRKIYPDLDVLLTGGDAPRFLNRLKSRIFAAPDLTLRGLYAIYQHQAHVS